MLDSQGLAKLISRDREVAEWLAVAAVDDLRVITSAAVLVEVIHPRINRAALAWSISRLVVEPVTQSVAETAADLLAEQGLHGHRHAVDAMVSATARAAVHPVVVLTSDPADLGRLCGPRIRVIAV